MELSEILSEIPVGQETFWTLACCIVKKKTGICNRAVGWPWICLELENIAEIRAPKKPVPIKKHKRGHPAYKNRAKRALNKIVPGWRVALKNQRTHNLAYYDLETALARQASQTRATVKNTEVTADKFRLLQAMAKDKSLTSAEVRLGIVLLEYFNAERGYAWPSNETLAQELGIHRTTVTSAWQGLRAKGYFSVQENKGRGTTNRYYPVFVSPPEPVLTDTNEEVFRRTLRRREVIPVSHPRMKQNGEAKYPYDHPVVLEFYQSFAWRKLRLMCIKRDRKECACCGATRSDGVKMNVDHIKPLRFFWNLRLDINNLQILCEVCNHGKGNWDHTDWRQLAPA